MAANIQNDIEDETFHSSFKPDDKLFELDFTKNSFAKTSEFDDEQKQTTSMPTPPPKTTEEKLKRLIFI